MSALKQRLTSYFKPKILHTDNGGEFKNKVMKNYLKENNIEHITRGLYNPQHQGAVESFNKTIKIFILTKDHKGKNFCLIDSINVFLIYYNNRRRNNPNETI